MPKAGDTRINSKYWIFIKNEEEYNLKCLPVKVPIRNDSSQHDSNLRVRKGKV